MRFKRIAALLIAAALIFSAFPVSAGAAEARSRSVILIDAGTGAVLYEKDADARLYPASLTKIMTVLLAVAAVERGDIALSDSVTAAESMKYDLDPEGSTANIKVGETMPLEELLYCALLPSANESCNVIAEYVAGNIAAFIQRMNDRASELGCTQTSFTNAHGLEDEEHFTTARDMSLIASEAARHDLFMSLCGTATHTVPATNLSTERCLRNTNALINPTSYYGSDWVYDGSTGMKTGHLKAAGYCLASAAERNGVKLICLTFGAETSSDCFADSTELLDWGFENRDAVLFPSEWAKDEVNEALELGIVPEAMQRLYAGSVTREHVAELFASLIEAVSGADISELAADPGSSSSGSFTDTDNEAVLAMSSLGILNGVGEGRFSPDGSLTREQAAAIVNRVARYFGVEDEGEDHPFTDTEGRWVDAELSLPYNCGIIKGVTETEFAPEAQLTTEQTILMGLRLYRMLTENDNNTDSEEINDAA